MYFFSVEYCIYLVDATNSWVTFVGILVISNRYLGLHWCQRRLVIHVNYGLHFFYWDIRVNTACLVTVGGWAFVNMMFYGIYDIQSSSFLPFSEKLCNSKLQFIVSHYCALLLSTFCEMLWQFMNFQWSSYCCRMGMKCFLELNEAPNSANS